MELASLMDYCNVSYAMKHISSIMLRTHNVFGIMITAYSNMNCVTNCC